MEEPELMPIPEGMILTPENELARQQFAVGRLRSGVRRIVKLIGKRTYSELLEELAKAEEVFTSGETSNMTLEEIQTAANRISRFAFLAKEAKRLPELRKSVTTYEGNLEKAQEAVESLTPGAAKQR